MKNKIEREDEMNATKELELRTLTSLAKVFPDKIYGKSAKFCDAALGQEASFQIAYRSVDRRAHRYACDYDVKIESELADRISLWRVENAVSTFPVYVNTPDKELITKRPGLFPDPLIPMIGGEKLHIARDVWHAMWVSVDLHGDVVPQNYPITVKFYREGDFIDEVTFTVKLHGITLPDESIDFTQWFHCDCIADVHKVKVFSEKHWELIERYMDLAAKHGINIILTPVLTPPLDTRVGGERPTVQLVEIEKEGDRYSFDFSSLGRYVEIASRCGIHRFEINHMFTQWGAEHAPKVVAKVNGRKRKIFGWDTKATSREYADFLRQLIPSLIEAFESFGVAKKDLFFHISDEPHAEHLDNYRAAGDILLPLIKGCRHIDALSNVEFYRNGLIETPVTATTHADEFLSEEVEGLWCYYYCGASVNVSNRFFAMPSARTRAIGVQIYRAGIVGFLHWGYNFYYTQFSTKLIDPYLDTSAGDVFPSGDAFSVYPYGNEAVPSLRLKVFAEALDDIKLLKLLEARIGREEVIRLIDDIAGRKVTFDYCPVEEEFYRELERRAFKILETTV